MSSISGLYTALSGLNAQRRVLDVTAHNVANQSTRGFHRQRVELRAAGVGAVAAVFAGSGQQVGGVDAGRVTRIVDQLAENRYIRESALQSGTQTLANDMNRIELSFSEPSDQGIASLLDGFWGGWTDLATLPGDLATRSQVLERAQTLVDAIRRAAADLEQVKSSAQESIVNLAADVNDLSSRIAQLNKAIVGNANAANDLIDERGEAMRQLAELTGAVARPAAGGTIDVSIGGRSLVSGEIVQRVEGAGGVLTWTNDGSGVDAGPSRAASLKATIDVVIPKYMSKLDGVATSLVDKVNTLHATGYDLNDVAGGEFFDATGVTALTISLSANVIGKPENLAAAAATGAPFDGDLALALAAIATQTDGPDTEYRTLIGNLGVETREAFRRQGIQESVTQAARATADSVGGVSIDEEMANLMSAQRAYEASARVLTTIDELLGVLMSTGRVGR